MDDSQLLSGSDTDVSEENSDNEANKIAIGPDDDWALTCTPERFAFLLEQDFFPLLVALGRAVNAIRFCLDAGAAAGDSDSPSARRTRETAFFDVAAHLYEILDLTDRLRDSFVNIDSFKQVLLPIVDNPKTVELRKKELAKIRNRLTFHATDTAALREGLQRMSRFPSDRHQFAVARGFQAGEVYYQIPNIAALVFVVGGEAGEYPAKRDHLIETVVGLAGDLVNALDLVIAEVFRHPERLNPPLPLAG